MAPPSSSAEGRAPREFPATSRTDREKNTMKQEPARQRLETFSLPGLPLKFAEMARTVFERNGFFVTAAVLIKFGRVELDRATGVY